MTRTTTRLLPLASLLLAACGSAMDSNPPAGAVQPDAATEALRSSWGRSVATVCVVPGINGKDLALPEPLPVDVQVGDTCALTDFQFRAIAGPISLPPGTYDVKVRFAATPACSGAAAISAPWLKLDSRRVRIARRCNKRYVVRTERGRCPSDGRAASMAAKEYVAALLRAAGIEINGGNPWDLQVQDERLYARVLAHGTLGAGEAYMDGWWHAQKLDEFFVRIHAGGIDRRLVTAGMLAQVAWSKITNQQGRWLSRRVARQHYDLSNELYVAMLGRTMQYTCAYYGPDGADQTLDEAQDRKLDLIARKLRLQPGMSVLELGGGFGGLARHLAVHHGCRVVSYNISREQVEFARAWCDGLPVEFRLQDYREAASDPQTYDRVVSIGLMEHVGPKNYRRFFEMARARLAPGGLALVHTIGGNVSMVTTDPWISRYIFPGGVVPSEQQITAAKEGLFVLEDWHNFGPDYDRTLLAWDENFRAAVPTLGKDPAMDERFHRLWRYYLNSCAGAFRARTLNLWQLVLSRGDVPRYVPAR